MDMFAWLAGDRAEEFAARMAGIPVDGVRFATYLLCAVLAAVCGYLLASFSGGAALSASVRAEACSQRAGSCSGTALISNGKLRLMRAATSTGNCPSAGSR